MIKALANQKIDLSKDEIQYLDQIIKSFGEDDFIGLFKTDQNGIISFISPPTQKPTSMILIFFLLNVMLNQRLRSIDQSLPKIEDILIKINSLEERVSKLENK